MAIIAVTGARFNVNRRMCENYESIFKSHRCWEMRASISRKAYKADVELNLRVKVVKGNLFC